MSTFTGTLAAWYVASHKLIDTEIKTWFDALKALTDPWNAFTPAWTSNGVAPVLGNGTITGKYVQDGKYIHYTGKLTMGSTTTFGTGIYQINLPVTAVDTTALGVALAFRSTAVAHTGTAQPRSTTNLQFFGDTGVGQFTQLIPFTWASGDILSWSITYEAA